MRGDDWVAVYGFGTWSPESTQSQKGGEHIMQFSYTAPVTNKLLLEAAASQFLSNWNPTSPAGALNYEPFIPVQERSLAGGVPVPNMVYHGYAGLNNNHQTHNVWRASLAYVTGAHSMKVGYQAAYEVTDIFGDFATHGLQYRFNAGVPDLITQRITQWQQANRTRYDAFYLQDQWTRNRLTLQGALRYEHAWSFFPEGLNGLLTDSVFGGPARTLARADGVTGYNDIAPAHGDGVRRVRQRQDGHQGEPVEVLAVCRQRRGVYRDQPGVDLRADGQPVVDRRQRQLHAELRPPEPAGAGQSRQRRRLLRRPGQPELLRVPADRVGAGDGDPVDPACSVAGACVPTTGSSARRCSSSCCRACRPSSASAAGGGATSPSPTTVPSGRRTSTSTRSPRRPTRGFPRVDSRCPTT